MRCFVCSVLALTLFFFTSTVTNAEENLTILEAHYGNLPDGAKKDVTEQVRRHVKGSTLRLEAGNDLFGDPAEQISKKLHVKYKLNEQTGEIIIREGDTLLLPRPELKGDLKLISATWGDLPDGDSENVLGIVKYYLKNNRLEVSADNDTLGDPASGFFKRLRVEYQIGDVKLARSVWEGGTLIVDANPPQQAPSSAK